MIWITMLALAAPQAAAPATIMTIKVAKLPATYTGSPIVHLEFADTGEVSTCALTKSSGSPAIDKIVCDQIKTTVKLKPVKKKAPEARDAAVEFVADKPKG